MSDQAKRLTGDTPAAAPRSVAEARLAVEAQRERISETIDQLEDRLVEKQTALRDRLDVARPVRRFAVAKPLLAVGIAAAAGVLLGLLGGSEDDEDDVIYLTNEPPSPSKAGLLARDLAHELAGAATALLVAQVIERVQSPQE